MLIPIKIGKKKYKIKPILDLTTSEFIELSKIEDCNYIKYIAWQIGISEDKAFFSISSPILENLIGAVPDVTKFPLPKIYDYSKLIDTVGQRHQVESSKLTGLDLIVFALAVAQARSNNINDVEQLRQEYLKEPFYKVLPAGFFFFENYRNGKKSVVSYLKKPLYLMKIKKLKNKLELLS